MSLLILIQEIYPTLGEEIFQVIGQGFPQILKGVYSAASPAAPADLSSGPHQIQRFVTL